MIELHLYPDNYPSIQKTGKPVTGSIEEQARQCIRNVEAILKAAASVLNHAMKMTLFVSDQKYRGAVNDSYADVFGDFRLVISTEIF